MIFQKLTVARLNAICLTEQFERGAMRAITRPLLAGIAMAGTLALGGCINVAAPDEPIVIELNINIRQEVIYRLAEDAADTIEENSDIF
jgi:hypothetical protein